MRRVVLLAAALIVVAACTSDGVETTTSWTTASTTQPPLTLFTDESGEGLGRLALQITTSAWTGRYDGYSRIPDYTVYSNGIVLLPGSIDERPPPVIRPVAAIELAADHQSEVVGAIEAMGLAQVDDEFDDSLKSAGLFDFPNTYVTLFDPGGAQHTYGVYALGQGNAPLPDATAALATLVNALDRAANDSASTVYTPERLKLFVGDRLRIGGDASHTIPWPLPAGPDVFKREASSNLLCLVLRGNSAQEAIAGLTDADPNTLWEFEGFAYPIFGRPLLPDEPGCKPPQR